MAFKTNRRLSLFRPSKAYISPLGSLMFNAEQLVTSKFLAVEIGQCSRATFVSDCSIWTIIKLTWQLCRFSELRPFPTIPSSILKTCIWFVWICRWLISDFEIAITSCSCAGLVEYYILLTTWHIRTAILRWAIVLSSQNTTKLDSAINTISTLESIFFNLLILFWKSLWSVYTVCNFLILLLLNWISFVLIMALLFSSDWFSMDKNLWSRTPLTLSTSPTFLQLFFLLLLVLLY